MKSSGLVVDFKAGTFEHHLLVPGWIVDGTYSADERGAWLTSLKVRPTTPDGQVLSRVLRAVPVGVLVAQISQCLIPAEVREAIARLAAKELDST